MDAAKRLFALENVTCIRGGRVLFQNLSCALEASDVLHLSGPNGAGKTSLLRIMAGALPASGSILWDGEDFLKNGAEAHSRRLSFLPSDDRSLKVLETANENLAFWADLGPARQSPEEALSGMGLSAARDLPVRYLSAGQRRRLSLARVLLKDAKLWLLDEPFNGLDAESAVLFKNALDLHLKNGGIAVIASHLPVEPPKNGALRRLELGQTMQKAAA